LGIGPNPQSPIPNPQSPRLLKCDKIKIIKLYLNKLYKSKSNISLEKKIFI